MGSLYPRKLTKSSCLRAGKEILMEVLVKLHIIYKIIKIEIS